MEKLVYLMREPVVTTGETLRARVLSAVATLRDGGARRIAVNVADEAVAAGKAVTIGRLDPPIRAMVSFWMENSDDRDPLESALRSVVTEVAGYLVVESVPTINTTQVAARGERTPGVNMVTCINRLPSLTREEFWRIWYQDHRRVAQETQSTFGYVRNTVVRPLTDGASACDGIVEEMFPIEALTDPKVWYAAGSDEALRANLQRMIDSVQRFLDLGPLESHPMSHYAL